MQKIIFVREPYFDLEVFGQCNWMISLNYRFYGSILGCFRHKYSEIGIYFNLIFATAMQNLTNFFDF